MKYQFSKVTLGSLLVFALSIGVLYFSGPLSVTANVAAVTIGAFGDEEVVLSGRQFQCNGTNPREGLAICATTLAGQELQIAFQYAFPNASFLKPCEVKFGASVFMCDGGYDYRTPIERPYIYIAEDLGLTAAQRQQIWLANPLINIPESTWGSASWWLAAGWALMLALAAYSQFWPKVLRNRLANVVVPTLLAAVLFVPTAWFTILALLFTGYVD